MEVSAKVNYLRVSPRKVRLVTNMLKGLGAKEALLQLRFLPKRASHPLEKLLRSALANAKHNFDLDEKNLRVKTIRVDGGPVSKRFTPRAFGRASPIRKRTSHITLILDELIPTSLKARRAKKNMAPEIRGSASREEVKDIVAEEESRGGAPRREVPRQDRKVGGRGFVGRIFNRKAV